MKKYLLKLMLLCCIGILALNLFACVPTTDQYKLEFIVDGEVYETLTTNGYSRIDPPEDPAKLGYSFAGWYFDMEYAEECHTYSLEKNPIKKDTKVYAKWEEDHSHACVAGSWIIESQATCKNVGKQVKRCTVDYCKKIIVSEDIPISTTHGDTNIIKADLIPATCISEGSYTERVYCSVCEKLVSESPKTIEIDKNAHDYINCELTKADNGFNITAECARESCGVVTTLENVYVTKDVIKEATCDEEGKIDYTYFSSDYSTLHAKMTETTPALGHKIVGVTIEDTVIYSEITNQDILAKVELYADANDKKCGEEVRGLFRCDVCDGYANIRVLKPHVGNWSVIAEPSCYAPGTETLTVCGDCQELIIRRDIAPTGNHQFNSTVIALNKVGERFDLVQPCTTEGCPEFNLILEDVPPESREIISDTCEKPDVIQYRYSYNRVWATYEEVIVSGHFVDGVRAETLKDANGYFDYLSISSIDDIKFFADTVVNCEEPINCYYYCSCCKEMVVGKVNRAHSGNWVTTKEATCTETGVSTFCCDFENCQYSDTKEIPKAKCSYEWELIIEKQSPASPEYFSLYGKCVCGETSKLENVLVTTSISKKPTCFEEGEVVYTYIHEGVAYTKTEKMSKIDHSINNVVVDTNGKFDYAEYVTTGKINLEAGEEIVCDSGVGVNGYFTCSSCGEKITVDVYRTHKVEVVKETLTTETPCIKEGTREYSCVYDGCDKADKTLDFKDVNHSYEANLVNTGSDYTLELFCSVEGCGVTEKYEKISFTDMKIKLITLATCSTPGSVEYSFKLGGEDYNFVAGVGKGHHTLHGVDYTTLLDGDGCISADTEGLRIISDEYAAFKCEVCERLVEVKIKSDEE